MPTRDFAVSRTSPLRKFRQAEELSKFALDVRQGLSQTQKEIPSQYLYDQVGTALFEAITYVPEYGLTRADERLLRRHAGAIVDHLPSPVAVAELGSGTGRKTRWILEALAKRQPVTYFPIDIAPTALAKCRQELAELAGVSIVGLEHSYVDGLQDVVSRRELVRRPAPDTAARHRVPQSMSPWQCAAGESSAGTRESPDSSAVRQSGPNLSRVQHRAIAPWRLTRP